MAIPMARSSGLKHEFLLAYRLSSVAYLARPLCALTIYYYLRLAKKEVISSPQVSCNTPYSSRVLG